MPGPHHPLVDPIQDLGCEHAAVVVGARWAWFDGNAIYIPTRRIHEAAGNILKEQQIAKMLNDRGFIAKRRNDRRFTVQWVPGIGRLECYALSRSEFGRVDSVIEPDAHLKVVQDDSW